MSILCIHVLIILVGLNNNILSYLMGGLCAGVTVLVIGCLSIIGNFQKCQLGPISTI